MGEIESESYYARCPGHQVVLAARLLFVGTPEQARLARGYFLLSFAFLAFFIFLSSTSSSPLRLFPFVHNPSFIFSHLRSRYLRDNLTKSSIF